MLTDCSEQATILIGSMKVACAWAMKSGRAMMRTRCLLSVVLMIVTSGTVLAAELVTGVAASSHEVAMDQRYSELLSRHLNLNWEGFRSQLPNRMADDWPSVEDPTTADFFELVKRRLNLDDEQVEILRRNGIVILDPYAGVSFPAAYYSLYVDDLPVLITTDSILHALPYTYSSILIEMETEVFSPLLEDVLRSIQEKLQAIAANDQPAALRRSCADVDLYVTVARNLLAGAAPNRLTVHSVLNQDGEVATLLRDITSIHAQTIGDPWRSMVVFVTSISRSFARGDTIRNLQSFPG